jgi:hypothetical protein
MLDWQSNYDAKPGRKYQGLGYYVKKFSDGAVRYAEADRHITLLGEVVDESSEKGRIWFFFPTVVRELILPSEIYWDGGLPLDKNLVPLVVERIEETFRVWKEPLRLLYSDAPYIQLQKDLESFGRNRDSDGN